MVLTGTRRDGAKTFELLDWSTDQAAYQTIDNPQVQSTLFLQVLTAAIDCTKHLPDGFFDPREVAQWRAALSSFRFNTWQHGQWGEIVLGNAGVPHDESKPHDHC